jgi:alpha-beta hydrolase superfamily lysophospholipase
LIDEESMMEHNEGVFQGSGNIKLYYQSWKPSTEPRAIVAIVHGVGEHSGRYQNLLEPMTNNEYAVYGFDLRGHGRSPGQRVYINNWTEYREDLNAFVKFIKEQEPGKAIFLYCHSLGSIIGLDYVLNYPKEVKGAIFSGTPFESTGAVKPALIALANVMSKFIPRLSMNLGLDITALSKDEAVVHAYANDPLVTRLATARFGTEYLKMTDWTKQHISEITVPTFFIHGEADRIAVAQAVSEAVKKITLAEKSLIIYPGGFHEPHNDYGHPRVMGNVIEWLRQHV